MIRDNVLRLLKELPQGVEVVAAAKTRTEQEVREALDAGIRIIGENYVRDTLPLFEKIGKKAKWHLIGHLQKNKVKKATGIFDMIETVDSIALAEEINKRCTESSRKMPVLIEVNSGREKQKSGVLPEDAEFLIRKISLFSNVTVEGLMTMGPFVDEPEQSRRYFRETKQLSERIKKLDIAGVSMKYLSMGMTDSYRIAIEEGANMVRIGTAIFGYRKQDS